LFRWCLHRSPASRERVSYQLSRSLTARDQVVAWRSEPVAGFVRDVRYFLPRYVAAFSSRCGMSFRTFQPIRLPSAACALIALIRSLGRSAPLARTARSHCLRSGARRGWEQRRLAGGHRAGSGGEALAEVADQVGFGRGGLGRPGGCDGFHDRPLGPGPGQRAAWPGRGH